MSDARTDGAGGGLRMPQIPPAGLVFGLGIDVIEAARIKRLLERLPRACARLVATPAIRNLVREGKTHMIYSAMQAGGQMGMLTMDQSLADLVREGVVGKAGKGVYELTD